MTQSIKKRIEEFDELHRDRTTSVSRKEYHEWLKKNFKEIEQEVKISLIDSLISELEGEKKESLYQMRNPDNGKLIGITDSHQEFMDTLCDGGSCEDVYNQALTDTITALQTLREELKNT